MTEIDRALLFFAGMIIGFLFAGTYLCTTARIHWANGALIAIALLILLGLIAEADGSVPPIHRVRDAHKFTYDIRDCPRTSPGETDLILVYVRTQADMRPTVTGCTRIVDRAWLKHR